MKKIFLDCGGHVGESIKNFKESSLYSPDFFLYSFEPNPCFENVFKNNTDVIFSTKAVWIKNEERDFYISKTRIIQGSSLKIEKRFNKPTPIKVKCFDFSQWVLDNFTKDDYIILKMDIEGAEYDVLNKMIEDGSINYISKALIEFHVDKMNLDRVVHDDLIKKLKDVKSLELLPELKIHLKNKK